MARQGKLSDTVQQGLQDNSRTSLIAYKHQKHDEVFISLFLTYTKHTGSGSFPLAHIKHTGSCIFLLTYSKHTGSCIFRLIHIKHTRPFILLLAYLKYTGSCIFNFTYIKQTRSCISFFFLHISNAQGSEKQCSTLWLDKMRKQ